MNREATIFGPDGLLDNRGRLVWLSQLRWWAMVGAMAGAGVATWMKWTFISAPGIAAGVLMGVVVNAVLVIRLRTAAEIRPNELSLHALNDLFALTWLLAWAGGWSNPLSVCFSFHVVLGALLTGQRGGLIAFVTSLLCLAGLYALEAFDWLPTVAVHDPPRLLTLASLLLLLSGLVYFALVLASRLRQEHAFAMAQRDDANANLKLLHNALDALKVGVEIEGSADAPAVRNPFAEQLLDTVGPEKWQQIRADGNGHLVIEDESDADGEERLYDVVRVDPADAVTAHLFVDRTEERMVQQRHFMLERLATLGRALSGVAHELNTPLTTMQTLAKDMRAALDAAPLGDDVRTDVNESVDLIIEESQRCRQLTQSLLQTAHQREHSGGTGETLRRVIEKAVRVVGHKDVGRSATIAVDGDTDFSLAVDSNRVLQILMNLIQNALRATEHLDAHDAPLVTVKTVRSNGSLHVIIDDKGPGLPDEVKTRLFEPFVTTRPAGEGTGLGLYTAYKIALELGGDLSLRSRSTGGTRAVLKLPA